MSISTERAKQLLEMHAELVSKLNKVDTKYSIDYIEPQLDLPDSLGLVHLEYTAKTDAQLTELAQQQALASYLSKKRIVDTSYATQLAANTKSRSAEQLSHTQKLDSLLEGYTSQNLSLRARVLNNGLFFSSILESVTTKLLAQYNLDVQQENTAYKAKVDSLDQQKTALDNKHQQQLTAIESERVANVAQILAQLREDEDKQKLSVTKYNASLDEREVKYKASCARTKEYARQAEYERALEASKLYAQLGETGFKNQMYAEKLSTCKFFLQSKGLNEEEALALIDVDSAVSNHLSSYYTTLKQWIRDTFV